MTTKHNDPNEWCRHYNGVGNSDTCDLGIAYDTVTVPNTRPRQIPCLEQASTMTGGHCPHRETHSPEEIAARNAKVVAFMEQMARIMSGEDRHCPHCGQLVERAEQVGRCVYGRPCGCRLYQGRLAKWMQS